MGRRMVMMLAEVKEKENSVVNNSSDAARLELYRLIGEGYKAIQDGRVSSINDVKERIDKRREERG